jgi:mono/diheme cytochrome c family protein
MSAHSLKETATVTLATTCIVATLLLFLVLPLASAEETDVARVFTTQQATTGKGAFEKNCAACHMRDLSGDMDAPPLAGAQFMSSWRTRSTKDLFQYMSTAMPPGSSPLSADAYASITAYILQSNGGVAGPDVLTTKTAVPIGNVAAKKPGS